MTMPWTWSESMGSAGPSGPWPPGFLPARLINDAGNNGLFFGNPAQLGIQAVAVGVTLVYSFVVTLIILKVLDWTMGLRVETEDEMAGLDISQHSEVGYNL